MTDLTDRPLKLRVKYLAILLITSQDLVSWLRYASCQVERSEESDDSTRNSPVPLARRPTWNTNQLKFDELSTKWPIRKNSEAGT
jgi:hypothetical protein